MGAFGWLGLDGTCSRKQHRQGIGALTGGKISSRPLGGRSGVTSPVDLTVSSTTYTVGSFTALLDLETDETMGVTAAVFDGDSTGSIDPASGSIIRWDLLYVTYSDGSSTPPTVEYLAGTTASTLPATPSNSMALAKIVVPKSGTGSPSIDLIAPPAVAAGGIGVYTDSGDYPDAPYVGQYIDDASLGLLRWDGSSWQRYGTGGFIDWTTQGVGGSYTAVGPPALAWCRDGRWVHWRGLIAPNSGTFATNTSILLIAVGNVPTSARTAYKINVPVSSAAPGEDCRAVFDTDGSLTIVTGGSAAPYVDMAGIPPYRVDA